MEGKSVLAVSGTKLISGVAELRPADPIIGGELVSTPSRLKDRKTRSTDGRSNRSRAHCVNNVAPR